MLIKVKNIISNADRFLFKKFGSDKTIKSLENLKEARIIFSYLNEIGKETVVRFVGGCVRKALSGETVDDIDLATSLEPEVVKNKLAKNNVKVIDTGILHGTVTAILSNKKFEITTLRKDILFIYLAGALGFEPRMVVPKTTALPLGYAPKFKDLIYHKIKQLNSFCIYAPVFWKPFFNFS